jgi:hypothetical protein
MNSRFASILALLTVASPGPLYAETPIGFRQLLGVSPVAVQRGTERTVVVRSNPTLDGAYQAFFDRPGIVMTYLETEKLDPPLQSGGGAAPGHPYRFKTVVPADQQPGVYEMRIATNRAVSSASHLLVTEYPVIEEQPNNDTRETAQAVSIPSAVAGACEKPEDVDFFKFAGKAGQRLSFQLYAQRVTEAVHNMYVSSSVYLMDGILTLYGPHGQVVAQNDNCFGADPFLELSLPEDGDYVLEVRDVRYMGSTKYVYCLEISDRPFAHAVLPLAIQRGTSVPAEVVGNIPGFSQTTLAASPDEPEGWKTASFDTPSGRTNHLPVLVSPHPQIVAAGNTSREKAAALALPIGVSGRFSGPDEVHYYTFSAIAGRSYLFEIESQRRGYALDSVLEIFDAAGNLQRNSDDGLLDTRDSTLLFKAPADGTFTLTVSDLHGRGGQRFVYYLSGEPSGPDFNLYGEYYYAMLAPGSRMLWFAKIERMNGFDGPVEIQIEGLPRGVSLTPATIPGGMNHCGLILSAEPDAPINASLVRVFGKATVPDAEGKPQTIVRKGRVTTEVQSQGGGQGRWGIKTQLVGVVQPLDLLKVEAEPAQITLAPGGKAEIKVRIQRNSEFKDAVTLAASFNYFESVLGGQLPPGVKMSGDSKSRLNSDVSEGTIILEADAKALPVQQFTMAVLARVGISFSISTNYASNPLSLTVLPAK